MIAESLVSSNGNRLVRTPDTLGTGAQRTSIRLVIGGDQVIHPIDFVHVMTFPHGIALWYNGTFRLLYRTTHIWFQLRTLHLPITMDGVNLTIIIKQDAQVVDTPLHIMMLPGSTNILGSIALQALTIDIRVDVELSVGITDARSPDALSINLLMVLQ